MSWYGPGSRRMPETVLTVVGGTNSGTMLRTVEEFVP
jgi:hypothetical protein